MFPLDGKVVTIYQLTFYEPRASEALENVLPHVSESVVATPCKIGCPSIFKDSSLLGIYEGPAPMIPLDYMYTLSTKPELVTVADASSDNASPTSSQAQMNILYQTPSKYLFSFRNQEWPLLW